MNSVLNSPTGETEIIGVVQENNQLPKRVRVRAKPKAKILKQYIKQTLINLGGKGCPCITGINGYLIENDGLFQMANGVPSKGAVLGRIRRIRDNTSNHLANPKPWDEVCDQILIWIVFHHIRVEIFDHNSNQNLKYQFQKIVDLIISHRKAQETKNSNHMQDTMFVEAIIIVSKITQHDYNFVQDRWNKLVQPCFPPPEDVYLNSEDDILIQTMIQQYKSTRNEIQNGVRFVPIWFKISQIIYENNGYYYTPTQIKRHYIDNLINPNIKKEGLWTQQEDLKLLKLVEKPLKWIEIAKIMERSERGIRSRMVSLTRKFNKTHSTNTVTNAYKLVSQYTKKNHPEQYFQNIKIIREHVKNLLSQQTKKIKKYTKLINIKQYKHHNKIRNERYREIRLKTFNPDQIFNEPDDMYNPDNWDQQIQDPIDSQTENYFNEISLFEFPQF